LADIPISVIITARDTEAYLPETLDSLGRQKVRGLEVILVDGGSADSTPAIIAAYCTKHPNAVSVALRDASLAAMRNAGLERAGGKYVAFLEGDDLYTPGYLRAMLETAERFGAPMAVGRMLSFDVFSTVFFESASRLSAERLTGRFNTELLWNPSLTNKIFLRARISELGLKVPEYGVAQDAAFSLVFAMQAEKIACARKGFAKMRSRPLDAQPGTLDDLYDYLKGYAEVYDAAVKAFNREIERAASPFFAAEAAREKKAYTDELLLKEITVLLYRYYRRMHLMNDKDIAAVCKVINSLIDFLSDNAKTRLIRPNPDIFRNGRLIDSKAEMNRRPLVTVAVFEADGAAALERQLDAIYRQYMPAFEIILNARLEPLLPGRLFDIGNISFAEGETLGAFRTAALDAARGKYIWFPDRRAIPDPKILQRYVRALEADPGRAFAASPLSSCKDGKIKEFKSSTLVFSFDEEASSTEDSPAYVTDLYSSNKLLRTQHLRGIKFRFSDDPVMDMYKIYQHSTFVKLKAAGIYLDMTEAEFLDLIRSRSSKLPAAAADYLCHVRLYYFTRVTAVKAAAAVVARLKHAKKIALERTNLALRALFGRMKLKNRVFFYTIRSDGELIENMKCVYDALDADKKVFAMKLPHPARVKPKIYYYLLTSKVIVTDDYLRYLRAVRLRDEQKVVQLWHGCGAFKRWSLSAPTQLTHLEELNTHARYDAVAVSSENVRQYFVHAFGVEKEKILPFGIPRTDELVAPGGREHLAESFFAKHPKLTQKTIYAYMPTFRELNGVKVELAPLIDFEALSAQLGPDEVFIIKSHPAMTEDLLGGKLYPNIKSYNGENSFELLAASAALITDYSSIMYEAVLLGRPVVFFCPDFEMFERDFYLRYPEDLPGPAVKDSALLLDTVRRTVAEPPVEKIKAFRESQLDACDGRATQRFAELIRGYLGG